MEHDEKITLDIIKKLRTHPKPNFIKNLVDVIPKRIIQSLVTRLKIERALVYIYVTQRDKKPTKTILGNSSESISSETRDQTKPSKPPEFVFTLPLVYGKSKNEKLLIAKIEFVKRVPFSNKDLEIFKQVSLFISDYIYEVFELVRSHSCEQAAQKIDFFISNFMIAGPKDVDFVSEEIPVIREQNFYSEEPLAGKVIAAIQKLVHRAVKPFASFFAILDNEKIAIDYFLSSKMRQPNFTISPVFFDVDTMFWQSCLNKNTFYWLDLENKKLSTILKEYTEQNDNEWIYIVSPVKNDKLPIAAWIYQFDKNLLFFRTIYEKLIIHAAIQSKIYAAYLFQRRTKKLIVEPCFQHKDTRVDNKKVFVLMPFSLDWSDRVWMRMIKPTVEEMGLIAVRADNLYGKDIMEDIWKSILTSRVVIADITGRNPNVFYELGIAHTIGKQVILLTQSVVDIPFDLNRYRHIVYQDNVDGFEKLRRELIASLGEILHR